MHLNNLPRVRQELLSEPFALPGGRQVAARLVVLPSVPVGPRPAVDDTLQMAVEVRSTLDAEFEQVAVSPVLSQFHEGHSALIVPTPAQPLLPGERAPVARLRLIHTGALQPRYELRVEGL